MMQVVVFMCLPVSSTASSGSSSLSSSYPESLALDDVDFFKISSYFCFCLI